MLKGMVIKGPGIPRGIVLGIAFLKDKVRGTGHMTVGFNGGQKAATKMAENSG